MPSYLSLSFIVGIIVLNALSLGCDDDQSQETRVPSRVDQFIPIVNTFDMMNLDDSSTVRDNLGDYGDSCDRDEDCLDRVCISSDQGRICSRSCLLDCDPFPDGRVAYCRSDEAQGDPEFFCYLNQDRTCQACNDDSQCGDAACINTADGPRCLSACGSDGGCPDEMTCVEGRCTPKSGSCDCNSARAGETRICELTNEFGSCVGEEACDPDQGWIGCNAPEPEAEICDGLDQNCDGIADDGLGSDSCRIENEYGSCSGVSVCLGDQGAVCYGDEARAEICDTLDNDCDGVADEDFTLIDGVYGSPEHCGGCQVSCEGAIPYASETTCDAEATPPRCVAVNCIPGYQVLDSGLCIPVADVLCDPCNDDSSCAVRSPGARCVGVGDPAIPETQGQVCSRDCSADGIFGVECPAGFECQALTDALNSPRQCLPSAGHCLCIGQPEGFSIPCSVRSPVNEALTCQGRRPCNGDRFDACILPQDNCDGIDNDCDGVIDNAFRSLDGRYDLDPDHCGRCNFSCAQLNYPNATAVCDTTSELPRCEMRCAEGFVDLDNGIDDGCECAVIAGADLPDGLDQNCDGIDGDRTLALFVSKVGSDEASGSLDAPLLTISRALEIAAERPMTRDIYVATGVYSENIKLVNGVSIYGGYALSFRDRDPAEHPTTILGRAPTGDERGTLNASGLSQVTRVDGFSIYGANATTLGSSSVAIFLLDTGESLTLSNNHFIAGNGAAGRRGSVGVSGDLGVNGSSGQDGYKAGSWNCQERASLGGNGGLHSCGALNVSGGSGGESHCPITQENDGSLSCRRGFSAQCRNSCRDLPCDLLPPPQGVGAPGQGDQVAPGGAPTYDRWQGDNSCSECILGRLPALGNPGGNGADGVNGVAGLGCVDARGTLNEDYQWVTRSGSSGGLGASGSGGGGGSAGSGFDTTIDDASCVDELGASGGGGGSGGCGGTAGLGGSGGGGSFAVLITYSAPETALSLPQLIQNKITRGLGGRGGAGGSGGVGGLGGSGALGGISPGLLCAEAGGRGGNGGDGGHGGGGGGGCGGLSVSVYLAGVSDLNPEYTQTNELLDSGRAGVGGAGGNSTGNPGTSGTDGQVVDILVVD